MKHFQREKDVFTTEEVQIQTSPLALIISKWQATRVSGLCLPVCNHGNTLQKVMGRQLVLSVDNIDVDDNAMINAVL